MISVKYSIIIPVYNRPDEIAELLESLQAQTWKDFEVLVIEDGSVNRCDLIVEKYKSELDLRYFYKENSGQGFSRNYGFERSKGEWFIVFDSDCIIPPQYLEVVDSFLNAELVDAYGGPDLAHENFTAVQKAISYSMTSFFTTGGIRGGKKRIGEFHPRSFNMGISRRVFEETQGYILPRKGEDIEFSLRIVENGFKTALINEAFVYHKRRTNFLQFFTQLHFFGTARINIFRFYRKELKLVHFFPFVFTFGIVCGIFTLFLAPKYGLVLLGIYLLYFSMILVDSLVKTKSTVVALLSVVAAFIQLAAYGIGFVREAINSCLKG